MDKNQIISALSDKEHEDFRQEVRAFVREQIAPYASELEEKEAFPRQILQEMGKRGWMGIPIPNKRQVPWIG